jgi:hypothetical protein
MPKFDVSVGRACNYKAVAAAQTTAQISVSSDGCPGQDYLERIIITAVTTAVGAVTLFDGATTLLTHNAQITAYTGTNVYTYELGILSQTTKGFNVTTGSSVSVVAVGRF